MILAVEPQCAGFEHERFNAALLAAAALASADGPVAFLAEQEHGRCVLARLAHSNTEAGSVILDEPLQFRWSARAWARLKEEQALCEAVLESARRRGASAVLFCSITSYTLIALKKLLARGAYRGVVAGVPHAILSGLLRRTRRIWNRPIDIVSALRAPAPPNLRLLALSGNILALAQGGFPNGNWRRFDHPYIFDADGPPLRGPGGSLKIGIFGALRHRIDDYVYAVRSLQEGPAPVEFVLLGHFPARTPSTEQLARYIPGSSFEPIPAHLYDKLAASVAYSLNISDPLYHRYVASATLLDSFNYLTPVLTVDNAQFEEYRSAMGDVGDSFASVRELVQAVRQIGAAFPSARYRKQVANIMRQRARFSPAQLSGQLKAILETS